MSIIEGRKEENKIPACPSGWRTGYTGVRQPLGKVDHRQCTRQMSTQESPKDI